MDCSAPSQPQPQPQSQSQSHVTCVGDSITAGVGASSSEAAYPAVLQRLLGSSYAVENDGRSGATMMKAAEPSYWSTEEFGRSTAWASSGGEVVIQLGTNDSWPHNWSRHETFLADCKALVDHYRASPGKPRVWVALIPPCCSGGGTVIANEVVPLLRRCAAERGVPTIDVFNALVPYPHDFIDGVHPNDQGAARIAKTVHDAIVFHRKAGR